MRHQYGTPIKNCIQKKLHECTRSYCGRFDKPIEFNDHNYKRVSKNNKICSLQSFRQYQDAFFIYKLLNYKIDCPILLQSINLYVPARLMRTRNLFLQQERHSDIKFKSLIYYRGTKEINLVKFYCVKATVQTIKCCGQRFKRFKQSSVQSRL